MIGKLVQFVFIAAVYIGLFVLFSSYYSALIVFVLVGGYITNKTVGENRELKARVSLLTKNIDSLNTRINDLENKN